MYVRIQSNLLVMLKFIRMPAQVRMYVHILSSDKF